MDECRPFVIQRALDRRLDPLWLLDAFAEDSYRASECAEIRVLTLGAPRVRKPATSISARTMPQVEL